MHRMVGIMQLANSKDKTKKETCSGQKPKVRWPGASEVNEWNCINVHLKGILEGLKGTTEYELNNMD